jgi:hypothetical protein
MASTVSLPAKTQINVVSTTSEYSAKSNLTELPGSYLTQATILVYDDILRFQNSVNNPTADVSNFNYNEFEGNVLWFMDELVGIESDWKKDASPGIEGNTAFGYVQFTKDSVKTAVSRYIGHLERFNKRRKTRDWTPFGYPLGTTMKTPSWIRKLDEDINGILIGTMMTYDYNHEKNMVELTYDQMLALAFVHLHRKESKDSNFVLLAKGDITAAKDLYKNNHHTNPDAATLSRLTGFFKYHIKSAQTLTQKVVALSPVALIAKEVLVELKTSRYATLLNTVKSWFGFK